MKTLEKCWFRTNLTLRQFSSKNFFETGHEQHLRQPLPEDRVNETVDYEINEADVQRLGLTATGEFKTIQHIELPESPIHVTNHRLTVYRDADGNV